MQKACISAQNKKQEPSRNHLISDKKESVSSFGAKLFQVSEERFNNWTWQLKNQVRTLAEAQKFLDLQPEEEKGFKITHKIFNVGISPYYVSLMAYRQKRKKDITALKLQVIPQAKEILDPSGQKDPLEEINHSPVKEIIHAYPDRVAFCVAQLCPVYCRYCFRKRRDDDEGLHYNRKIIANGINYIKSQKSIKDVLITGGDPFIASDEAIESLLIKLRALPHVEVIRFGTRTPVTMPQRITPKLLSILKKYHPIWLNTHFNCPEELTVEACLSLRNIADSGIPMGNQTVLLKGVNDTTAKMLKLCQKLIRNRVRPYYLFYPHMIEGTRHLRVHYKVGLDIIKGLRGNISGFGIPVYVIDTPSGKVPLGYNHILGEDKKDLILEDLRGEIWRESEALQ